MEVCVLGAGRVGGTVPGSAGFLVAVEAGDGRLAREDEEDRLVGGWGVGVGDCAYACEYALFFQKKTLVPHTGGGSVTVD